MTVNSYITQESTTKWCFDHFIGYDEYTGKQIRLRKKGFKSEREAKFFEAKAIAEYEANSTQQDKKQTKKKFAEIAELWLLQYEGTVKENTFISSRLLIRNKILPVFGEFFIEKINFELCQDTVNSWTSTYAKSTLLISLFNRIYKFGIKLGYANQNPMLLTTRPKNTQREDYDAPFYSKGELDTFLSVVKENEPVMTHMMFHLLAYTGLRRAEILGLRWTAIDLNQMTLTVNRVLARGKKGEVFQTPKTKKSRRTISLDRNTVDLLRKWKIQQSRQMMQFGKSTNNEDQLVFTTHENKHLPLERPNKLINKIIKSYDLPYITIHGFRHTHCSLLFEAGVSMNDVRDRLGHSSIVTTMNIYTHVTKNKKSDVADKFAAFMSQ